MRRRPNLDLSPLRSDKQLLLFCAPRLPLLRRIGPLAGASFTQYGPIAWLRLCKIDHFQRQHGRKMIEVPTWEGRKAFQTQV